MKNVTIIIGAPIIKQNLKDDISTRLALITGGLTLYDAVGYWCDDGNETKEHYTVKAEREPALRLTFTIEDDKFTEQLQNIKDAVTMAVHVTDTQAEWVHMQVEDVKVMHFQV